MTTRTTRIFINLCAATSSIALGLDVLAVDPIINEIRVDQPGLDLSEYVEFRGTPGATLDGLTLVVIGDDDAASPPAQNGTIESVVALTGPLSSTGYFVLAESSYSFGVPDQIDILNFENPDNVTFLLVSGFTGFNGQDLDTNDDGVLDIAPWTAVLSSVALVSSASPNGTTSEFVYSTDRVGPDGATTPAQLWRCDDSSAWRIGAADTTLGTDTPGASNPVCGGTVALTISEIRIDQPGNDDDEYFEIQGPAGFNLNGYTYIVVGDNNTVGAVDLAGSIENITPLDGAIIPSDGYLLVAKATMLVAVPDLVAVLNFENSDNVTHMLVTGFTGLINGDVDADNNCTLDAPAPWATVVDSVALIGSDVTCYYSTSVAGPDGVFTTVHAYRCFPDGTWSLGAYDHLAGGDSPGTQNRACGLPPVLECGEPTAGLCTAVHSTGYCSDSVCCTLICSTQPTCCTVSWDVACVAAATAQCNQSGSASCDRDTVAFSEIRIDQTGSDNDEWFELIGAPGTSLADLTVVVIGDGGTALSGPIEAIVSLAGQTIPSDGHFAVAEPTFTWGLTNIDFVTAANVLNFENSDNVTFMLVRGFTGLMAQDLDTNDDGVLDVTPWTAVVDSIALIKTTTNPPTGTEWYYGPNTIGPDTTFVPGHIWRCEDTGCWNIGIFTTADPTGVPTPHDDTPGIANLNCGLPCAGDVNLDGNVDAQDLSAVLANWNGSGSGDINGDGTVGGADLSAVLANWGPCV